MEEQLEHLEGINKKKKIFKQMITNVVKDIEKVRTKLNGHNMFFTNFLATIIKRGLLRKEKQENEQDEEKKKEKEEEEEESWLLRNELKEIEHCSLFYYFLEHSGFSYSDIFANNNVELFNALIETIDFEHDCSNFYANVFYDCFTDEGSPLFLDFFVKNFVKFKYGSNIIMEFFKLLAKDATEYEDNFGNIDKNTNGKYLFVFFLLLETKKQALVFDMLIYHQHDNTQYFSNVAKKLFLLGIENEIDVNNITLHVVDSFCNALFVKGIDYILSKQSKHHLTTITLTRNQFYNTLLQQQIYGDIIFEDTKIWDFCCYCVKKILNYTELCFLIKTGKSSDACFNTVIKKELTNKNEDNIFVYCGLANSKVFISRDIINMYRAFVNCEPYNK